MILDYDKSRNFENTEEIICPHCEEKNSSECFYESSREEDDDKIIASMTCEHCEKDFNASIEKYNQREGFTTYPIKCKDDKHQFEVSRVYEKEGEKYNVKVCVKCWESSLKLLKPSGEEYSEEEIQKKYFLEKKINQSYNSIKKGEIFAYDDSISIRTESEDGNRDLFLKIISGFEKIGYKISTVDRIDRDYEALGSYYKHGQWRELEFEAHYYPAGMEFKFYQNEYPGKRKKGEGIYEFDKKSHMPYLLKKRLEYSIMKIEEFVLSIPNTKITVRPFSILDCHKHPDLDHRMSRNEKLIKIKNYLPDLKTQGEYNLKDKNGNLLVNGVEKYFYDYNKKLNRGIAYHNINNMWWIVTKDDYYNVACFDLFDYNNKTPIKLVNQTTRLKEVLSSLIKDEKFERCAKVRDIIKNLKEFTTK